MIISTERKESVEIQNEASVACRMIHRLIISLPQVVIPARRPVLGAGRPDGRRVGFILGAAGLLLGAWVCSSAAGFAPRLAGDRRCVALLTQERIARHPARWWLDCLVPRLAQANLEPRALEAGHLGDLFQDRPLRPADEVATVRIVDIVFSYRAAHRTEICVPSLRRGCRARGSRRRPGARCPLPPIACMILGRLWASEHNHHIGCGPDVGSSLDGIPQEIAGHEYVGIVDEKGIEPPFDRDDPLELQRVVRHGLAVAVGVNDFRSRRADKGAHDLEEPLVPVKDDPASSVARNEKVPQGQPAWSRPKAAARAASRTGHRPGARLRYGEVPNVVPVPAARLTTQSRDLRHWCLELYSTNRWTEEEPSMLAVLMLSIFATAVHRLRFLPDGVSASRAAN